MSNLQSGASKAQLIDILNSMKFPIMGAGGGFAPIGTINFFDASVAPQGWLACDGSVVNIADYPDLATYYASVHGSANFYGGNGTTTFAVPDLRGEFLRGTGTNGHTNQGSGANVGVHQDGTQHVSISTSSDTVFGHSGNGETTEQNKDSVIGNRSGKYTGTNNTSSMYTTYYTSRPTNTSFLICVKATVAGDPNEHVYSTEEQVVGMTEDGEVLYERVLILPPANVPSGSSNVAHNISNIKTVLSFDAYFYVNANGYYMQSPIFKFNGSLSIQIRGIDSTYVEYLATEEWSASEFTNTRIVLQYTKTQS